MAVFIPYIIEGITALIEGGEILSAFSVPEATESVAVGLSRGLLSNASKKVLQKEAVAVAKKAAKEAIESKIKSNIFSTLYQQILSYINLHGILIAASVILSLTIAIIAYLHLNVIKTSLRKVKKIVSNLLNSKDKIMKKIHIKTLFDVATIKKNN